MLHCSGHCGPVPLVFVRFADSHAGARLWAAQAFGLARPRPGCAVAGPTRPRVGRCAPRGLKGRYGLAGAGESYFRSTCDFRTNQTYKREEGGFRECGEDATRAFMPLAGRADGFAGLKEQEGRDSKQHAWF